MKKTVQLESGAIISAEPEEIEEILRKLGVRKETQYYDSDSRGLILIADMDSNHLRNAILKKYKEWIASLYHTDYPREFVGAILNGPSDPTFKAMLKELGRRDEDF